MCASGLPFYSFVFKTICATVLLEVCGWIIKKSFLSDIDRVTDKASMFERGLEIMDPKLTVALLSHVAVTKLGAWNFTPEPKRPEGTCGQVKNSARVFVRIKDTDEEDGVDSSD